MKILFAFSLCILMGCSALSSQVFYSFEYGGFGQNAGVKILKFRYGKLISSSKLEIAPGEPVQAFSYTGYSPIQDELYVKWQVDATGKIFEKTVRIGRSTKLPIENNRIRFLIQGELLRVFIIAVELHGPNVPDCEIRYFEKHQCEEIRSAN